MTEDRRAASRICRKASDRPPREAPSGPATLPPDLLEGGARRLGNLGLLAAGVCAIFSVAERVIAGEAHLPVEAAGIVLLAEAGLIVISVGMFALSRRRGMDPVALLDQGLLYEVLFAFLLGITYHFQPLPAGVIPRGWTPVAVWIVAFPLLVPATHGKAALATLASAAMDPLGLLLSTVAGRSLPGGYALAVLFLPTLVAVVVALVGWHILYELTRDVTRAREMGSYRLVSLIGRGGMGEVWCAEHRMLARPAAIKLIHPGSGVEAGERLARFEREAQATARLRSPHTIQLYDFGVTDEGAFYSAMELLDGLNLEELVERFGPLPPERAVHILRQACCSLAEAHQRGLVHRDVKPGNVFVCRYGLAVDFVKVLDFGLVKDVVNEAENLTATGFLTGTPSYMAPELALGRRDVDGRADLYALGCVGFWLLTGDTVFERRSPIEVIHDHAMTPAPRPSSRLDREIPRALEDVLMSCLQKDPNLRPESARELDRLLKATGLGEAWTPERAEAWWAAHLTPAGEGAARPPAGETEASPVRLHVAS